MSDMSADPDSASAAPELTGTTTGFGRPLAQAREALGLSVGDIATRLRLHPRQISALEDERLESLPEPAFVRGFVRNYAKEVKLDPAPLLAALAERVPMPVPAPDTLSGGAVTASDVRRAGVDRLSRSAVIGGAVLVLFVLGLIGWLASMRAPQTAAPTAMQPAPQSPAETSTASPAPAPATAADSAAPLASGASGTAPTSDPLPPAAPSPTPSSAAPSPASAGSAAVSSPPPGAAAFAGVRISVGERPSWVEVTQDDGKVLLTGLQEAGTERRLAGVQPPLRLVIGNASTVALEFRGKPVDLKPHTRANDLARLTLE
jgi:cytoskeleton protein RodZ